MFHVIGSTSMPHVEAKMASKIFGKFTWNHGVCVPRPCLVRWTGGSRKYREEKNRFAVLVVIGSKVSIPFKCIRVHGAHHRATSSLAFCGVSLQQKESY